MSARKLDFFERYLSLWVLVCMIVGLALGKLAPEFVTRVSHLEIGRDSHVNAAIAVLIWMMIYPMAITLFGATSPAALATVVGVLVEVPVMLSVCRICTSSRDWYRQRPALS